MTTSLASLLAWPGVQAFGLRRRLEPRHHQQNCGQHDDAADDHQKQSRRRHRGAGLTGGIGHQDDQHVSPSVESGLTWECSTRHPFRYLMPHSPRTQALLCFQVPSVRRRCECACLWRLMQGSQWCLMAQIPRHLNSARRRCSPSRPRRAALEGGDPISRVLSLSYLDELSNGTIALSFAALRFPCLEECGNEKSRNQANGQIADPDGGPRGGDAMKTYACSRPIKKPHGRSCSMRRHGIDSHVDADGSIPRFLITRRPCNCEVCTASSIRQLTEHDSGLLPDQPTPFQACPLRLTLPDQPVGHLSQCPFPNRDVVLQGLGRGLDSPLGQLRFGVHATCGRQGEGIRPGVGAADCNSRAQNTSAQAGWSGPRGVLRPRGPGRPSLRLPSTLHQLPTSSSCADDEAQKKPRRLASTRLLFSCRSRLTPEQWCKQRAVKANPLSCLNLTDFALGEAGCTARSGRRTINLQVQRPQRLKNGSPTLAHVAEGPDR
jgi:hypothetical protein